MKKYEHLKLPERAHALGCPAKRVETYEAEKPERVQTELGTVTRPSIVVVVRCIDCAGQIVVPQEEALANA